MEPDGDIPVRRFPLEVWRGVHHLSRFRCKEDCDGSPSPGHHGDARVGNDGSGAGDVGVLHLVKG
jgi:hypothetical protein